MIFIGYSSKDRYDVIEPMMFHFKNHGFPLWYDFHDMIVSDNREKMNFEYGIKESTYVIFIISDNFFTSNCALEELVYAQQLYEKGEITLFIIFYEYSASLLPKEFNWLTKIIYGEVTKNTGTLFITNQIIEKILNDIINKLTYRSIPELSNFLNEEKYIMCLLETYLELDLRNYSARIAILYSLYLYLKANMKIDRYSISSKIINRIYKFTSLNLTIDHLSLRLFEMAVIILINDIFQNSENNTR